MALRFNDQIHLHLNGRKWVLERSSKREFHKLGGKSTHFLAGRHPRSGESICNNLNIKHIKLFPFLITRSQGGWAAQ